MLRTCPRCGGSTENGRSVLCAVYALKLVGHKTESVYRRYAILVEQDLREGVVKLAQLHASEPPAPGVVVPLAAAKGAGRRHAGASPSLRPVGLLSPGFREWTRRGT